MYVHIYTESLPGVRTDLSSEEFLAQLAEIGVKLCVRVRVRAHARVHVRVRVCVCV